MNHFTNPLDNVQIASPCSSDWNQMYGNQRKRFCSECSLNVYNLSDMTREEAESLLINSEGRLCVRFFRRSDGTVLTTDCPVGWRVLKKRVSTFAVALSSLAAGFLAGLLSIRTAESTVSSLPMGNVPPVEIPVEKKSSASPVVGEVEWEGQVDLSNFPKAKFRVKRLVRYDAVVGRVDDFQRLEDVKVNAWVK